MYRQRDAAKRRAPAVGRWPKRNMNDTSKAQGINWLRLAVWAGPISWPLITLIALMASSGPDGGWNGLGIILYGINIILMIHLVLPVILIKRVISRRRLSVKIDSVTKWGLAYYGLVAFLALLFLGPAWIYHQVLGLIYSCIPEQFLYPK